MTEGEVVELFTILPRRENFELIQRTI